MSIETMNVRNNMVTDVTRSNKVPDNIMSLRSQRTC